MHNTLSKDGSGGRVGLGFKGAFGCAAVAFAHGTLKRQVQCLKFYLSTQTQPMPLRQHARSAATPAHSTQTFWFAIMLQVCDKRSVRRFGFACRRLTNPFRHILITRHLLHAGTQCSLSSWKLRLLQVLTDSTAPLICECHRCTRDFMH